MRLWPYPRANGDHTIDVLRRLRAAFPDDSSYNETDRGKALNRGVEAAHGVCPYSNATRGNIDVTLTVV